MVQCGAVCCSVLQCVAVRCSVLQCGAVWCCERGLSLQVHVCKSKYVAVCCSVLQRVAVCCSVLQCVAVCCSVLQSDARVSLCEHMCARVSVLQCVAVCCSVLQCVAHVCQRESAREQDCEFMRSKKKKLFFSSACMQERQDVHRVSKTQRIP